MSLGDFVEEEHAIATPYRRPFNKTAIQKKHYNRMQKENRRKAKQSRKLEVHTKKNTHHTKRTLNVYTKKNRIHDARAWQTKNGSS